ncbi:MAG: FG-GAP-like repeat-containing protein [Gammaproteobacteria bacterium]
MKNKIIVNALSLFVLALVSGNDIFASSWIEPNAGQTHDAYKFVARAGGVTALIAPDHIDFSLSVRATNEPHQAGIQDRMELTDSATAYEHTAVRLHFVNASPSALAIPGQPAAGVSHYFTGNRQDAWETSVPHVLTARLHNVYPGIDVVYHLHDGRLEYDFEVSPGVDPKQIRVELQGASKVSLDEDGNWVAHTSVGELRQLAPVVYQTVEGKRHAIAGAFKQLNDGYMAFTLGHYQEDETLVIDPVIEFSGYAGGSGVERSAEMKQNSAGNYVISGVTDSVDFPLAGQPSGDLDVFVMEIDAISGAVNWVTIVGGAGEDSVQGMAIDSQDNIVLAGYSESDDYPTLNAFQSQKVGNDDADSDSFDWDATVTKLSGDGSMMLFSTYLGGADLSFASNDGGRFGYESLSSLAVDVSDNIYVTGQTAAPDFPATATIAGRACMQTDMQSESIFVSDIVFAKFSADGTLLASGCIGGEERELATDIKIGPDGSVYVAGSARSNNFPTTAGVFQLQPIENLRYSPVIVKLAPTLDAIDWATYTGEGLVLEIAIDAEGSVYGSGNSFTNLFPTTTGAFQTLVTEDDPDTNLLQIDNQVAFKLQADGSDFIFSTYLGSPGDDRNTAMEVDAEGRMYLSGVTKSPEFPVKNPLFATIGPVVSTTRVLQSVTHVNNLRRESFNSDPENASYYTLMARNGVNKVAVTGDTNSTNRLVLGEFSDFGTSESNSSDMTFVVINGDTFDPGILVTNTDDIDELHQWDNVAKDWSFVASLGTVDQDTRAAETIYGRSSFLLARYGEANQLVSVFNNGNVSVTSTDFGRPDGNTTALAVGKIGPTPFFNSVVFANEGQDIRLYPDSGSFTHEDAIIISNTAGDVSALDIGDVDGDGANDLIVARKDGPVEVYRFVDGVLQAPIVLTESGVGNNDVVLIDADDDGDRDIFIARDGIDMYFENSDGTTFERDTSFRGGEGRSSSLSSFLSFNQLPVYFAGDAAVSATISGRPDMTLSVLNPSGTDLEFSTFLPGGGSERLTRGMNFASGSDSKILITGSSDGVDWPQVNTTLSPAGLQDIVFMVLELDQDSDSSLDGLDNCLLVSNPDQRDSNGDGFGNACDADLNNDGIVNFLDLHLFSQVFLSDNADADFNGDGMVNFADIQLIRDSFLQSPGPGAQ